MFLFELENPDVVKFAAIVSQLKGGIDNNTVDSNWTTDMLIDYFQQNGINLDITDLYDMIKNSPMNSLVSNIQGNKVIFKGKGDVATDGGPSQSQKVVQQMAQSAMK